MNTSARSGFFFLPPPSIQSAAGYTAATKRTEERYLAWSAIAWKTHHWLCSFFGRHRMILIQINNNINKNKKPNKHQIIPKLIINKTIKSGWLQSWNSACLKCNFSAKLEVFAVDSQQTFVGRHRTSKHPPSHKMVCAVCLGPFTMTVKCWNVQRLLQVLGICSLNERKWAVRPVCNY